MEHNKVTGATIARTVVLVLALINNCLVMCGANPLPIEDEQITQLITLAFTIVSAGVAWWKNNSFTKPAIEADKVMEELKANNK